MTKGGITEAKPIPNYQPPKGPIGIMSGGGTCCNHGPAGTQHSPAPKMTEPKPSRVWPWKK